MKEIYEKGRLAWVAPGAVRYTLEHIELLLPWLYDMREGAYPPEPSGSYTGGKRSGLSHHAPYEAACLVAAEMDRRLAQTGLDRYLVEDYYCQSLTVDEIARKLGLDDYQVMRRIRSAVSYIASGSCPRWLNCIDCGDYTRCRREKRVGISYRDWVRHRRRQWFKAKVPQVRTKI